MTSRLERLEREDALRARVVELEKRRVPVYYIPEDGYEPSMRGYRVAVIVAGEDGYRWTGTWPNDGTGVMPYFWGPTLEDAQRNAEKQNARRGVTSEEAILVVLRSMERSLPARRSTGRRRRS